MHGRGKADPVGRFIEIDRKDHVADAIQRVQPRKAFRGRLWLLLYSRRIIFSTCATTGANCFRRSDFAWSLAPGPSMRSAKRLKRGGRYQCVEHRHRNSLLKFIEIRERGAAINQHGGVLIGENGRCGTRRRSGPSRSCPHLSADCATARHWRRAWVHPEQNRSAFPVFPGFVVSGMNP